MLQCVIGVLLEALYEGHGVLAACVRILARRLDVAAPPYIGATFPMFYDTVCVGKNASGESNLQHKPETVGAQAKYAGKEATYLPSRAKFTTGAQKSLLQ